MDASRRRTWTLVTVSLATFMTYLDNNIVNVAIPAIQRDLHLSASRLEWVVSGYILVFAALLLAGGRLADAYGRKRLFLLGLGIFTAASLLAGLAGSADLLIVARALQGLGAALVTPTTLAIISASYRDPRERAAAVGIWTAVGAAALAVGPLLGGLLSQHASWEWIFYVNVPLGLGTLALATRTITESREVQAKRLDLPGLSLSALALTALTWALIQGGSRGWTDHAILGSFGVALVAGVVFVLVEAGTRDAMVDVSLFRDRVFSGGIVALMLWAFGLFGIYFFTSIYLQEVLGFDATTAGLAFVPMASAMIIAAIVSESLGRRIGEHRLVAGALLAMGGGIASVALLGAHTGFASLMPSLVVIGISGGLTTPLTASVLSAMPADRAGVASGLFNASREVAGLLGITIIGAVLSAREAARVRAGADPLTAYLSGYRLGLVLAGVLVAVGGVAAYGALRGTRVRVPDTLEGLSVPELA
ncbi:MAG TPA: MFS transporter [Mycobacteriales bacterium]